MRILKIQDDLTILLFVHSTIVNYHNINTFLHKSSPGMPKASPIITSNLILAFALSQAALGPSCVISDVSWRDVRISDKSRSLMPTRY